MTDRELAARWDADHRLAAMTAFVAGIVVALGTAVVFTVGLGPVEAIVNGGTAGSFGITLVAGLLIIVDLALLVFVVALAHAVSEGPSFGLTVTTAVATLATAAAATIHLVWGNAASGMEVSLSADIVEFLTWLAANVWLLPLFGLLVGATLLALSLALRGSPLRFARRLGTAATALGLVLVLLAPFTGFEPDQMALAAVAMILVAVLGISSLLLVAVVRLGILLRTSRSAAGEQRVRR